LATVLGGVKVAELGEAVRGADIGESGQLVYRPAHHLGHGHLAQVRH